MSKKNGHTTNGNLPDYAAKKPVAITRDGKFILPTEERTAAFDLGVGSLHSLDISLQQKLTLQRIKVDPKYNIGILNVGSFKKDEVIAHVEKQTALGRRVIDAELHYCNEFVAGRLPTNKPPVFPKAKPDEVIMPPWKPGSKKIPIWFKNTALFCEDTITDPNTKNAANYRIAHVHPVFLARGFNVVVLKDYQTDRAHFVPEATKPLVVYISGIGHGSPTQFTGYGDWTNYVIEVGAYDPAEVKGKVIHLLSCQTAQQLGSNVVAKGAKAYAGYYENFHFVWQDPATPEDDQLVFWECDSAFDIFMACGATVEAAHNAVIAMFNAAIAQRPNTAAATWLMWDRDCFRSPIIDPVYGDETVVVPTMTRYYITIPFEITKLEKLEEEELVKA
jgi:hypothetical protein